MPKHARIQKEPTCPSCGLETYWDEDHQPVAWRHVESESRWCTTDHGPVYPVSYNLFDRQAFRAGWEGKFNE